MGISLVCSSHKEIALPTLNWQLVNGKDFVSSAIDIVEDEGSVCHVEFVFDQITIGARAIGGVAKRPLDNKQYNVVKAFSADCTQWHYNAAYYFLEMQLGKKYDFVADAGVLFHRNWRNEGHWMCSELWTRTMEVAKLIKEIDASVNTVTPQTALIISSAIFGGSNVSS